MRQTRVRVYVHFFEKSHCSFLGPFSWISGDALGDALAISTGKISKASSITHENWPWFEFSGF